MRIVKEEYMKSGGFGKQGNKLGNICILIQAVLLTVSIVLIAILGLQDSPTTEIVCISFDLMALLMMMIVARSCINGRIIRSSACFFNCLMSTYMCIFFESISWLTDGNAGLVPLGYVANIGCNCFTLICAYVFYEYVCISCDLGEKHYGKRVVQAVVFLGIAAELLNIRFGYFYTILNDGTYVRNRELVALAFLPFVMIIAICCINVIKAQLEVRVKMLYLSYAFIPFVTSIWYTVTGLPPTFFIALFVSLMFIYSNIYIVQGKQIQKNELKIAKQKNQMALSQIRPHFLYNALGSIEVLCKSNPAKAGEAVHFFSRYLRMNMDALGDVDMINFSKELEHIHNYIWLEKMRFEEDLEYDESIEIKDFQIPVLSVQPLVENAVKHGMMGKEDGVLHVKLSTFVQDNCYCIKIEDDGAGFDMNAPKTDTDERSHLGMSNVKERIKMLAGGEFLVESKVGEGTSVTILLKIE